MRDATPDTHSFDSLTSEEASLLGVFMPSTAIFLAGWTALALTPQHVFGFSLADPWQVVLNVFPGRSYWVSDVASSVRKTSALGMSASRGRTPGQELSGSPASPSC